MKKRKLSKKIECMVLVLFIFCLSHLVAAPCGDVNSDGSIDIIDALLVAQHYVNLDPENFDQDAADVNADGGIDIVDALLIAQYYVGLITELPGCEEPTPSPEITQDVTPSPTPDSSDPTDPFADNPVGFASLNGGTTGGEGGQIVTVSNQSDLEQYVSALEPYIIKVQGTITISPFGEEIEINSNKTVVGVGANATIREGGLKVMDQQNVIIRNLTIRDSFVESDPDGNSNDFDGIQTDNTSNLWIDHCHLSHCGDGCMDIRKNSRYVTVSWCIFSDNRRGPTFGWTDFTDSKVTMHHNWIRNTKIRNPVFDQGIGHFYNNYSTDISEFGHESRGFARMVVENSYWDNVIDPYNYTADSELVVRGSILVNCTGATNTRGTAFDPSSYYSYTLDPTEDVPDLMRTYAGPSDQIQY